MVAYRDLHRKLMALPNHCMISPIGTSLTVALPNDEIVQIKGESLHTMTEDEIRQFIKSALKKK